MTRMDTALGSICALAAALLFGTGVVIQASAAPQMPRGDALRVALLGPMLRSVRWLWGAAIALLGWALHAAALSLAPLTVVQPVLALMLVVVLVLARVTLHEQVGAREIIGSGALIVGIATIAATAPARSSQHASAWAIGAVLVVLAVLALATAFVAPAPDSPSDAGGALRRARVRALECRHQALHRRIPANPAGARSACCW